MTDHLTQVRQALNLAKQLPFSQRQAEEERILRELVMDAEHAMADRLRVGVGLTKTLKRHTNSALLDGGIDGK